MSSSSSSLSILVPHHYSTTRFLSKPFSSSKTLTLNLDLPKSNTLLRYGPSLSKGLNPNPIPNPGGRDFIDRSAFSRAFDVAALRVPAADCSSLERRLRGHLLNWPRVRNVARSPGDELDPDIKNLLRDPSFDGSDRLDGKSDGGEEPLSPVLYREKLAKEFNCRGFVKFRNLARISRPKKKRKEVGMVEREKESCYKFEVIHSGGREGEEMKRLLGEEFGGAWRWWGPTRLLLLDEGYAKRGAEGLPEAVKVAVISL